MAEIGSIDPGPSEPDLVYTSVGNVAERVFCCGYCATPLRGGFFAVTEALLVYTIVKERFSMKQSKGLKLVDILVTVVIAIVFGIIYKLWGPLYNAVQPFGFKAEQLIYGMWFIAGTVAALVIRKPGVALLAELAASSAEFVTGSEWGLSVLISGILQGLFAEIVFALFLYKRFTMGTACLAAVGSTFGSLIMDYHYGYIEDLAVWNVTTLIVARAVGAVVLAGVLAYVITKALEATGVTQLVRPASAEDYRSLD